MSIAKRCLLLFIDDITGCPISSLLNSIPGLKPFPVAFPSGSKSHLMKMWYVDPSDEDYLLGQILLRPMKMAKLVCSVY
jgi:hypothetical protein